MSRTTACLDPVALFENGNRILFKGKTGHDTGKNSSRKLFFVAGFLAALRTAINFADRLVACAATSDNFFFAR